MPANFIEDRREGTATQGFLMSFQCATPPSLMWTEQQNVLASVSPDTEKPFLGFSLRAEHMTFSHY